MDAEDKTQPNEAAKPIEPVVEKITGKRIVIDLPTDMAIPAVKFEGEHVTKREIALVQRALAKAHREQVREYRKESIIKEYEERVKNNVN